MATLNIKNFPDQLYERLREQAQHDRRSISQQAIRLLERALELEEPRSILDLQGLGRERWTGVDAADHVASERDEWS